MGNPIVPFRPSQEVAERVLEIITQTKALYAQCAIKLELALDDWEAIKEAESSEKIHAMEEVQLQTEDLVFIVWCMDNMINRLPHAPDMTIEQTMNALDLITELRRLVDIRTRTMQGSTNDAITVN